MSEPNANDEDQALHVALRRLLEPLAKLAVSKGVTHAALDEWLRAAMVKEAFEAHPDLPPHRRASRVSATTGLHRREVNRLLEQPLALPAPARSRAAEVFAHWRSAPAYRTKQGAPRVLPRQGPAPSFESLSHAVTRDVHPRTMLEELLRLKLAELDVAHDTVALVTEGFVPRHDAARMAAFLGDNVGDHLSAAVANLVGDGPRHFEQAVFADGLSEPSVQAFKGLVGDQWRTVTQALVPALERLIERDQALDDGAPRHRVRLGLFGFDSPMPADPETMAAAPAAAEAPQSKTLAPKVSKQTSERKGRNPRPKG